MRSTRLGLCLLVVAACDSPLTIPDGNARFSVRESVNQLDVTHATPGDTLTLRDGTGMSVATGTVDKQGSYIFRKVPAASGYTIHDDNLVPAETSRHLTVLSVDASQPPQSFYANQKLAPGFGYITTRDGTQLSAYVTLPGPPEMGPYPTVVDYSGYDPSRPGQPIQGLGFLCDQLPSLCDAPNDPSALIASLFGYATVSVNVRGTGCSGGAYDFFETLQLLDGYDVIETVAAQDWVQEHKVGMVGLSYPGIAELFVAQMRPPSLESIAPLSVIGNIATTMVPGGILNDGFALEWVTDVLDGADPYGQGWEKARVDGGDTVCAENQLLHSQKVDNVAQAKDPKYYVPEVIDPLNPTHFVHQIDVPVFMSGAWQDEQTGPFFITLLDQFKSAPVFRATVFNGVHRDGFQPAEMIEWKNFLDIYVAHKVPVTSSLLRSLAPQLFQAIFQLSLPLPPDRFANASSPAEAKQMFEAEQPLRVLWQSGIGDATKPGAPIPTTETRFSQWPPTEQMVERLYLHADGSAAEAMPTEASASSEFTLDPANGERGILAPNGSVDDPLPAYDWKPLQDGLALAWETAPLAADEVFLGTGSADLWIKSTVDDADLQVTISEVRADGQEMYVQSGWLRASSRKLDDAASTPLWPALTYLGADEQPLVPGEWTQVRVPIAGFGHPFQKGSRIRLAIDTPGNTRADWRFGLKMFSTAAVHTIGHDTAHPSSIALPLLPSVALTGLVAPPCPSLRGQQCRAYAPVTNTPGN